MIPFQHQDQTNSEALHAQEFTHMNNIVFFSAYGLKKKNNQKNKLLKKNRPTDPLNFQAKRVNKPFIF